RHHIVALVENLPRFSRVRQLTISSLKRFVRIERFEDHSELARIHAEAAGEEPVDWAYAVDKRTHCSDEELWPPPLITGNDFIAMGFPPGPHFKEILTRVEDEQLEGRLKSHEDAMEYVRRNFV